jgi:nitrate reductase alpha subunit
MGWLPSAPQLKTNPLEVARRQAPAGHGAEGLCGRAGAQGRRAELSCEDPDDPKNWPRNMFVWRSNLLGSSGKGHEYFLKHLLGTTHGVQGKDLGERARQKPAEVKWHDEAPEGKLDLLVTLDFRMSTTCVYSDIVLPTATWYEKNDLNTSDMHPFIHPLTRRWIRPGSRAATGTSTRGSPKTFSEVAPEVLGRREGRRADPIQHDSPGEMAQPFDVKDWKRGESSRSPARPCPITVVERDYPNLYKRFTSLGPLMDKLGNGGKGIAWNTGTRSSCCAAQRRRSPRRPDQGHGPDRNRHRRGRSDPDAGARNQRRGCGQGLGGAVKFTGRDHTHLAKPKEDEKIRFRDIVAQPRKIISSPTWSGLESEKVCYNAGYTNVHELIPWRTLTGRQQLYQDHLWMRAFGEGCASTARRSTPRRSSRCIDQSRTATRRSC